MKPLFLSILVGSLFTADPLPAFAGCGQSDGRMLICDGPQCIERAIGTECSNTTMVSYAEQSYSENVQKGYLFIFSSFLGGKALQLLVKQNGKQVFFGSPKESPLQVGVCQAFPFQSLKCSQGFVNPADSTPFRR